MNTLLSLTGDLLYLVLRVVLLPLFLCLDLFIAGWMLAVFLLRLRHRAARRHLPHAFFLRRSVQAVRAVLPRLSHH